MYQPEKYKRDDLEFAIQLIDENPFANFILMVDDLLATHVPILRNLDSKKLQLYGHMANHNPQLRFLEDKKSVLLIFKGADSYISSSWYSQKNISTWDYSAVHLNCTIRIQSPNELVDSLKNLVHHFEKEQKAPLEYDQIPQDILADNLTGITGFWCEPYEVKGVGKWHQGLDLEDMERIIQNLNGKKTHHQKLIRNLKKEHGL